MPEIRRHEVSDKVDKVITPLANLGWQTTGYGQEGEPRLAGVIAVWIGKKHLMPTVETMRENLAADKGELPEGYGVSQDEWRTVVSYEGSPEGLLEFGNRALRYAGVQLLEQE